MRWAGLPSMVGQALLVGLTARPHPPPANRGGPPGVSQAEAEAEAPLNPCAQGYYNTH